MIGYWFAQADAEGVVRLSHGDDRVVRVGETLTVAGPIELCTWGLHASRRVLDALMYAPGSWLALVRLSGTMVEATDKVVASARTTLWLDDVSEVLCEYACDVAERALWSERMSHREPDVRSWTAVETTRQWLAGQATATERYRAAQAARLAARALEGPADRAMREDEAAAYEAAVRAAWAAAATGRLSAAAAAAEVSAWGAEAAAWRAVADGASESATGVALDMEEAWQDTHLVDLLQQAGMPAVNEEGTR